MNKTDIKILSRAAIQLLLDCQKSSEKAKKARLECTRHKKASNRHFTDLLIEKERAAELQKMVVILMAKYDGKCGCCVNPENCKTVLCSDLSEQAKVLKRRWAEQQREEIEAMSSSSGSSESD